MGTIDGKFDSEYLVTVNLGSDELQGVLFMTMRDVVILYHLSKDDVEQRKLDVAFIGAKYMLKLENMCSVSVALVNTIAHFLGRCNFNGKTIPRLMQPRNYIMN
ncbi:high mobility group B protein 10-like [Pyrus ussuriensis x Pyrus communis]|uniref:High mobility group B protein 10-like n=1 Tax=Pyrus ussuriensis x Pyrus communis TaxID=2448454 RepID=A0A5N5GDL6_9ROSA|nr:high mobility group B protein 10-like [Pyrus ussuriensis x Pyrus communis]